MAQTNIYVHYDTGFGSFISLRGDFPLSWEQGVGATPVENGWKYSLDLDDATEIKILLNDRTWSEGKNYKINEGNDYHLYPIFGIASGQVDIYENNLRHWGDSVAIEIYTPPNYHSNSSQRYPVIYAQDGQNLFNTETVFNGRKWFLDEITNQLIKRDLIKEVIIVGIHNRGFNRLFDYTPTRNSEGEGGGARKYLDFVSGEVKPFVEERYRTLLGRENTTIMGSSLGGLFSFYAGRMRSDIFSKVACISSSFQWDTARQIQEVINSTQHVPFSIYLDAGTDGIESEAHYYAEEMYKALRKEGYKLGKDMIFNIDPDAAHEEQSWAKRVALPLMYLLS